MIVGLTGGIGSGKSAAGKYFVELGIDVIDADHISRNILDENTKAKDLFIKRSFALVFSSRIFLEIWSASITSIPNSTKYFPAADFPEPIPPVRPTIII